MTTTIQVKTTEVSDLHLIWCSHTLLKIFTTDIWDSSLLLTNNVLIDYPTYLRLTFAWPPRYHHITSDILRDSVQADHCSIGTIFLKWAAVRLNVSCGGYRWSCGDNAEVGRRYGDGNISESIRILFSKSSGKSKISVVKNFNV